MSNEQQIISSAKVWTGGIPSNQLMTFVKSFAMAGGKPLDSREIFNSYQAAYNFALTSDAYIGQKLVVIDSKDNSTKHYSVETVENGVLKELGSGSIQGALIFKGTAIGDPETIYFDSNGEIAKEQTSISKQRLPISKDEESGVITYEYASNDNIGHIYFWDGKEYASTGKAWESLGWEIDTSNFLTESQISGKYLLISDANNTFLTKAAANTTYAKSEYVGSDSEGDSTDYPDFQNKTLVERIKILHDKFDSYSTSTVVANTIDSKISTATAKDGAIYNATASQIESRVGVIPTTQSVKEYIDASVGDVNTTVSGLSTAITGLQGSVSTLNSDVSGNKTSISNIDGRVKTLEGAGYINSVSGTNSKVESGEITAISTDILVSGSNTLIFDCGKADGTYA